MRHNSITLAPVRSLEVGDLIAMESLGNVICGKITGVVYSGFQLTAEQRAYLERKKIEIPQNENDPICSSGYVLLFGGFRGAELDHMFVQLDRNVAVFPYFNDPRKKN